MSTYTFINPTFADVTSATGLTTSAMGVQTGNTGATTQAMVDNAATMGLAIVADAPSSKVKAGLILALLDSLIPAGFYVGGSAAAIVGTDDKGVAMAFKHNTTASAKALLLSGSQESKDIIFNALRQALAL